MHTEQVNTNTHRSNTTRLNAKKNNRNQQTFASNLLFIKSLQSLTKSSANRSRGGAGTMKKPSLAESKFLEKFMKKKSTTKKPSVLSPCRSTNNNIISSHFTSQWRYIVACVGRLFISAPLIRDEKKKTFYFFFLHIQLCHFICVNTKPSITVYIRLSQSQRLSDCSWFYTICTTHLRFLLQSFIHSRGSVAIERCWSKSK